MKKRIFALLLTLVLVTSSFVMVVGAEASAPNLDIEYCNLSFRDSVCIKYAVRENEADVKILIWTAPEAEYALGTEDAEITTYYTENIDGEPYMIFDYTELTAKQMADVVYARAYAKVGGVEYYGAVNKYSILQYAYNKLGKTTSGSTDDALKELLTNMLMQGASAQRYFDYKEDRLATSDWYQVRLTAGVLEDGCTDGLYLPGDKVRITAPETDATGAAFTKWIDRRGNEISTAATCELTVGHKNEIYMPVYAGAPSDACSLFGHLVVTDEAVQATCTTSGLTEGSHCDVCGKLFVEQEVIEASHNYIDNVCSKCGFNCVTQGFIFALSNDGESYYINGYEGTDKDIVIPAMYNEKPVIGIADRMFSRCDFVESITISEGIKTIGFASFSDCISLKSITIPDSIISIDYAAFSGCTSLTTIVIGSGLEELGNTAFYDCPSVTSVCVSAQNKTFDSRDNCNAIIQTSTNKLVKGFENSSIPDTVEIIGDSAFLRCKMTSIEIPASVTRIDFQAFVDCDELRTVYYGGTKRQWGEIDINNGFGANSWLLDAVLVCTGIDDNGFICESLGSGFSIIVGMQPMVLSIPDKSPDGETIIRIYEFVFDSLKNIIVEIPSTIKEIDVFAFFNCEIVEIRYAGTIDEWNNISKNDGGWNYNSSGFNVICTDGVIEY